MAINIVDIIQKHTPFPELKKIDPNVQDLTGKESHTSTALLGQAAIPAVLTAIYRLSRNDAGSSELLLANEKDDMLAFLFQNREEEVVEKVAAYAMVDQTRAHQELENIADQSVNVIKEFLGREATPQKLKTFMNDQRHQILSYLPAQMQLGDLLHDEQLDDRTNKMEGPVSNFMHKIEDKLSQGGK
jgi:hypothetical protein